LRYFGDFSGGLALDQPIDFGANTFLAGENMVVTSSQGFEKRMGTDVINAKMPIPKQLDATGWVGCTWDGGLLDIELLDIFDLKRWNATSGVFEEKIIAVCKGIQYPTPAAAWLILFNMSGSTKFDIDTATHIPLKWGNAGGEDTVLEPKLGEGTQLGLPYALRLYQCQNKLVLVGYPLGSDATGENFTDGVCHWTDGDNLYRYGLTPPTSAPTVQAGGAGTGSLQDGEYYLTYFYRRSGGYGADSLPVLIETSQTLTGGVSTQSIGAKPYYSRDPQVTTIVLCRTLKIDPSTYYEVEEIANDYDSATAQPAAFTTLSDSDNVVAANSLVVWDNYRPPFSIDSAFASNRGFFVTLDKVYYSKLDHPEHIPPLNCLSMNAKGGMNLGIATIQFYALIFRESEIWVIDTRYPESLLPTKISDNLSIFSIRSFCLVGDGSKGIFFTKDGFYLTDGMNLLSLSEKDGRSVNREDLVAGVDWERSAEVTAVYDPVGKTYMCVLPYLDGGYRLWIFNVTLGVFSGRYIFPAQPVCMRTVIDEKNFSKIIIGMELVGTYDSTTDDYYYLVEMTDTRRDISVPSDVGETTYQSILCEFYLPWYDVKYPQRKIFRSLHLRWFSDSTPSLTVTLGGDFGDKTVNAAFSHPAVTDFPDPGDDVIPGWDWSGLDKESQTFVWGALDQQAFHYSVKFREMSQYKIKIFDFWLEYDETEILEQG
jgi:hypothetical protein